MRLLALGLFLLPGAGPLLGCQCQMVSDVCAETQARNQPWHWFRSGRRSFLPAALSIFGLLVLGWLVARSGWQRPEVAQRLHRPYSGDLSFSAPDAALTPGATILLSRSSVCSQANVKNKEVPESVQRMVFEEYGLAKAQARAYEVDYLVTPALGGADDIRNLWPHSYSSLWNARVRDALEDRLRDMVCDGRLDLADAQREIAGNWIQAYKKYFHTDRPLPEHVQR